MKTTGVIIIALAMLVALTGVVLADQPVPAVPEKQGITTSTTVVADGIVTESDALAWTLTNLTLNSPPLETGEIQYTTAYDASLVAQAGTTTFVKTMAISTDNKPAATMKNVDANTLLTFVATADGGNAVGAENILIDGAGNYTTASDRMLCPFASVPVDQIPAYCNIVQAGSAFDLTVGTVKTAANDRFVGTDATVPVALNYNIAVSPYGTTDGSIPAIGSASAYVKAHIQEARVNGSNKAEDLQYAETSTVSGYIQSFVKDIKYQSGKSLMP